MARFTRARSSLVMKLPEVWHWRKLMRAGRGHWLKTVRIWKVRDFRPAKPRKGWERVLIVASGPSLKTINLSASAVARRKTVAVNNSWQRVQADVLYACDPQWWETHDTTDFQGERWSQCDFPGVYRVPFEDVNRLSLADGFKIGGGGNSGFQALNLALHWGARDIALAGFDCRFGDGGAKHWHPDHAGRNPQEHTLRRWFGAFRTAAQQLEQIGVNVWHVTPGSALDWWETYGPDRG